MQLGAAPQRCRLPACVWGENPKLSLGNRAASFTFTQCEKVCSQCVQCEKCYSLTCGIVISWMVTQALIEDGHDWRLRKHEKNIQFVSTDLIFCQPSIKLFKMMRLCFNFRSHVLSSIVSPSGRETIWRSEWSCFEETFATPRSDLIWT